ncbi:hypothetical protein I2I11_19630 [Pontibacter sp. 172403-2]|uniref:hypothetical protein n=1 Tax=Pontibacter rufus TaxID=2791028 RepID=UPI0018B009DD|nr:hypothetical protein [Pontibacter sp. 172403-2]MBF9255519.1 hypothetical protein [Pontibacter sp. 172403-2]
MLEYVYARRWAVKGPRVVLVRMLTRAILCYLAFAAIMLVVFLTGDASFRHFVSSLLLFVPGHSHADLFKCYALLIPVAFLLMWVRFRLAWKWQVSLVLLLIAMAELAQFFTYTLPFPFQHAGSLFLGLKDNFGPSIIHSIILIMFGGLVANYASAGGTIRQRNILVGVGVVSFGAIAIEIGQAGLYPFLAGVARYAGYRAHNSYIYFAYGILTFILYWGISWLAASRLKSSIKEKITYYGGNTFIIFFYGNVVILLTPAVNHDILPVAFAWAITAVLSLGSVNAFEWAERRFAFIPAFNRLLEVALHKSLEGSQAVLYRAGIRKRPTTALQVKAAQQVEKPEKVLVS